MPYLDVNWIAVILAAVASMALGMGWYMGLSKPWVAATGKKAEDLMGSGGSTAPFAFAAVCQLIMAYFIAMLTPVLLGETTAMSAIIVGVHMWLGFILTSMVLNHRYQNMSWNLTLIDGGYLLGVVVVQGLVIGLFG